MREQPIIYLGQTTFRAQFRPFGIRTGDLASHVYILGKTGVGKSTLLRSVASQLIRLDHGCGLIDPHGDLALSLKQEAKRYGRDVLFLDVPDRGKWHFNPLSGVSEQNRPLVVAGVVDVFKKLWRGEWGPRLEHILRNSVATLLAVPSGHLGMLPALLTDDRARSALVAHVCDRDVLRFWRAEFERASPSARLASVTPILNKVGAFLGDARVRSVLAHPESSFDLRSVLDSGTVFIANLSKGELGEGPSALLGSLLVSSISLAALSRADSPPFSRRPFALILDEFQTFSTLAHATLLAEVRKYGLSVVLANQYLGQLDVGVREAVLGNAGTLICFRVGGLDAPALVRELPVGLILKQLVPRDLVKLPNFHFFVRLMIDGQPSNAFSGRTTP